MPNRQIFSLILLGIIVGLAYLVVKSFLVPVTWATITAFVTWPVYNQLLKRLKNHRSAAALIMTTLLLIILILPVLWLLVRLHDELSEVYRGLSPQFASQLFLLPNALARIPVIGSTLQDALNAYLNNPSLWEGQFKEWLAPWMHELAGMIGGIGRNALKLMVSGVSLFFFYRDGKKVLEQIRKGLRKIVGETADGYFKAVGETTYAVVYGLIISALAQGLVAGIGYRIMGVGTPILLGALTALTSLIPFIGTMLIWGPIGVWLLLSDHVGTGFGLLAWGAFIVHPTDNVLRPLLISNVSDIPLLIVLFGVLGGLLAFGMIGLFIGPLILAVLLAIWREWLEDDQVKQKTSS